MTPASPRPRPPDVLPAGPAAPWPVDGCPPAPLVVAGQLCLPPGAAPAGARHVVGDVLAVGPPVTAAHRALALALLLGQGHGVLVRATAAWVWSGEPSLRPVRAEVAVPPAAPPLPGPRPAPARALPVRRTRWAGGPWSVVGGVALSPPEHAAADCARRLPEPLARRCLEALRPLADLEQAARLLRGRSPAPPGTAAALDLIRSVADR